MNNDKKSVDDAEDRIDRKLQLIVFQLGGMEYSMVIDQIKEVVITPKIARIPLTPPYIKGVANIRGNIITIVDLEARFGLDQTIKGEGSQTYTLVVESDHSKMGILVQSVPNTLNISESKIDKSPDLVQDQDVDESYILGIVNDGDRMIVLIDVLKVISKEELSKAINKKEVTKD
ncbi:MAG: chemotaxis protein CheW [Cyclobacteriaceae bacterium]|nr:purine-binding chemotaxis protein CheW [Cyclobacteriaceae bacterium]MCH8516742.1 chemotaxis protein CheW [Cyclobacteriaceae bacterium]